MYVLNFIIQLLESPYYIYKQIGMFTCIYMLNMY